MIPLATSPISFETTYDPPSPERSLPQRPSSLLKKNWAIPFENRIFVNSLNVVNMKRTKLFFVAALLWAAATVQLSAQSLSAASPSQESKSILVKVKGVTCAMDLKTIAANVEKIPGVSSCIPGKQGATTVFEVLFNPVRASEKDISAAIEGTPGCEDPADRPYKVKW